MRTGRRIIRTLDRGQHLFPRPGTSIVVSPPPLRAPQAERLRRRRRWFAPTRSATEDLPQPLFETSELLIGTAIRIERTPVRAGERADSQKRRNRVGQDHVVTVVQTAAGEIGLTGLRELVSLSSGDARTHPARPARRPGPCVRCAGR